MGGTHRGLGRRAGPAGKLFDVPLGQLRQVVTAQCIPRDLDQGQTPEGPRLEAPMTALPVQNAKNTQKQAIYIQ